MGRSRRQSASTRFSTADPEKSRFIWLQPNTLFGKLPIIQQITQLERQELEPILGTSKIQLFRNFRDIRIIPTGNSFLLQGINPSGGRVRVKPILDVQFSSKAKENSQAYVRLSEAKVYRAIAKLLESKLREQLENEHTDSLFAQFAEQSQPLSFFPIILDSIVNPETFKQLSAFVRVRLEFHPENHTIAIKNSENISLFLLQPKQLAYLILLHVISEYEYYQAFDYPLPEVIQNSLMILSIQGKTSIPSKYLEPRVKDLFPQEFQACEDVIIEFLQADTPDKSLLIFSSSQLNTRLYPRLKLADAVALELLGMLYSFTYPLLKQQGRWERAATLFRFMSLYELFQDEEFKHFRLTRISLKKLLEISFGSVTQTDLVSTAVDEQLEVQFVNANDNLHIDLRLSFTSPEEMQSYHSIVNTVSISHRHPHFYACLELITQLWSSSEERLRFLDANWMNKLVEQLRQAGNYWISYFELQPHLQKLSESPNPEIARLVQKLYVNATQPRPYFRYFLGIQGEDLIISPYPIFLENWSSATINFEITEENSLRLNIFASRSPHFFGFCRKVLALAKNLLDLGAAPGEERVRFNIPKVINKIETHTLALIQRYIPPFPEMIDRLQAMLLDISLYAPQAYGHYLNGYPANDLLSQMSVRFFQLTPSEQTVNLLDPAYTTLYTQDAIMQQYLATWRSLRYPNPEVLNLLMRSLQLEDTRKQLQLQVNQAQRTSALLLMLDTLLKSVQAITQYEIQIIAHQPQSVLIEPEIQKKIQALLAASENMETEWQILLKGITTQGKLTQESAASNLTSEDNFTDDRLQQSNNSNSP